MLWADTMQNTEDESLILVALLHDLCKTYYYSTEMRNKKDENGKWIQVPFYTVNDKVPYGHGEKSVMMIEEYIKLKPVERYAIRWHMGFRNRKSFTEPWERLLRNIHSAWQSMKQIWKPPTSWRVTMSSRKEAPSNLEMLISEEVLPAGTTLDEAVEELTDELNCVECIALEQCADCFGEDTRNKENPRCREVVRAYLKQDYKKKEDK